MRVTEKRVAVIGVEAREALRADEERAREAARAEARAAFADYDAWVVRSRPRRYEDEARDAGFGLYL